MTVVAFRPQQIEDDRNRQYYTGGRSDLRQLTIDRAIARWERETTRHLDLIERITLAKIIDDLLDDARYAYEAGWWRR